MFSSLKFNFKWTSQFRIILQWFCATSFAMFNLFSNISVNLHSCISIVVSVGKHNILVNTKHNSCGHNSTGYNIKIITIDLNSVLRNLFVVTEHQYDVLMTRMTTNWVNTTRNSFTVSHQLDLLQLIRLITCKNCCLLIQLGH